MLRIPLIWRSLMIACLLGNFAMAPSFAQDSSESAPTLDELIHQLGSDDDDRRAQAAAQLINHLDEYEKFVEPLSDLLVVHDRILTETAERIFHELGRQGIEALDPNFETEEIEHLNRICSAIKAVGDPAWSYQPELIEILKNDPRPRHRMAAMYALTGFSEGCPEAIPFILSDLKDKDMNVTLFACRLIIKTGEEAGAAVAPLVELLENGVISQRGYAIWALAAIGPTNQFDTVSKAAEMANRFHVVERERALFALGLLGEKAKEHIPIVRKWMNSPGSNLEGHAAVTLWKITGDAEESVNHLIDLIKNDPRHFDINGLKLLEKMGPAAAPATDFLVEQIRKQSPSIRVQALDALAAIGPAAQPALDDIRAALDDEDAIVRLAARLAIQEIDSDAAIEK